MDDTEHLSPMDWPIRPDGCRTETSDPRSGHRAHDCPNRVEVTTLADAEPEYIHGCHGDPLLPYRIVEGAPNPMLAGPFPAGQTSAERVAELVEAADIPQGLRDRLLARSDGSSDGLVHWRGLDSQEVLVTIPAVCSVYRPTRCGRWESGVTLGYPLEYVTCPECRELAAAE